MNNVRMAHGQPESGITTDDILDILKENLGCGFSITELAEKLEQAFLEHPGLGEYAYDRLHAWAIDNQDVGEEVLVTTTEEIMEEQFFGD